MAQRRMFSKSITNSSQFLMMPQSSQNLYFHLGMNADDDGFCEHFSIMRMTDSKPDDLKVLQAKGFVTVFDDKVLVIRDWKENNYLRSDRYQPSKYLGIYGKELLELGIPNGNQRYTQDRIGKEREESVASQPTSFLIVKDEDKKERPKRDKTAWALREKLYDMFEKDKGKRPTPNTGDYKAVVSALKTLNEGQIVEVVENALYDPKVVTVRGALSAYKIDKYRYDNA